MPDLLHDLLERTRPLAVSDLFLCEGRRPFVRENGHLTEISPAETTRETMEELYRRCGCDPDDTLDRDVGFEGGDGLRFRANLHRQSGRAAAVLRHVRARIPNMESLNLPEALLTSWLQRSSGLILLTGPTGSGKSTTIASCLEWLNHNGASHIVTVEDPIEFLFHDQRSIFTQREIGQDTRTFASGLRSAMRQSPDVIFVGEIRDRETAESVLQASETGHLVISSMQSHGLRDTFSRVVNLFPPSDRATVKHLLAHQLVGVFCQILLPGERGGLYLASEYVENGGGIRQWILDEEPSRIIEFVRDHPSETGALFLQSVVRGVRDGHITQEVGARVAENAVEYRRALRGIS